MAEDLTPPVTDDTPDTSRGPTAPPPDLPLPADPGGTHAKGFTAETAPGPDLPDAGPIPLAAGPDVHPAYHVPERDNHVKPTGRAEDREYGPNDRVRGSDR